MRRNFFWYIPVCIMLTMMTWSCAQKRTLSPSSAVKFSAVQEDVIACEGNIVGNSNKTKTLSIVVGKGASARTMMVKHAKLPTGVTAIKPGDVQKLLDSNADVIIIDSRPETRYAQSHLPGAVSIPVGQMKTALNLLPVDKNKLLLFYCGGYT